MTQESRLVIVIDSQNAERNAKALADEMSRITERGDSASQSTKDMGKQFSVTNNIVQNFNTTVNNANSSVQKTVEVTKQATQQNQKFSQEIKNTSQELDKQEKSIHAYGASIKALAGFMVGLVTVNEAIARADGATQMAARIRNATDSAAEFDLVQERLYASTKSTYRALGEAQEVYLGLAGGMKALGYATNDTLDVSDSLSFSFTANAARADQAQSAIDAFSKSMAKGKIDADAWISIVTAADNIIADMAKTTGKTEVQIRELGATGKISLEDLIKTLKATRDSNQELADAMENSLADGLTTLSNAVTKLLGEINQSTGATNTAAAGLGLLADNIDIVMNAAMAGGLAYLTKTIIAKTVATDTGIISTIRSRQASVANAQAEVTETTATLNAAKAHLANIQATNAEAQAKYGATAAAARYAQAQAAVTAATNAQTEAQKKLSLASLNFGRLASGAFALIGGPIGAITLGVAGLTAVYSYFNGKAEEATARLKEQAEAAKLTKDEIKALSEEQRKEKLADLAATLDDQNKKLKQQEQAVASALIAIQNYALGNVKVTDISNKARLGTISYTEAIEQLKDQRIPSDLRDALLKQVSAYDVAAETANKTKKTYSLFGIEVALAGNKAENAIVGLDKNTKSLTENEKAALAAKDAQKKYADSLFDRDFDAQLSQRLLAKNYTPAQVKALLDLANWARKNGVQITTEMYQAALRVQAIEEKNNQVIEAKNKALKETTDELSKQQKILSVNAKVQANAAKFGFTNIESKYSLPAGTLSAIHMIESRGNAKAYNKDTGATGGFQFLSGTAKQYGVKDRTDLAQSAEGAGKYMSYLLKLFKGDLEKAVRAYHAGEGNVQKGKGIGKYNNQYWKDFQGYMAGINGYSAGDISSKDFSKMLQDDAKMAEEQARLRIQLENEVADQQTKIRNDLAQKLEEVDKANFSPERKAEIVADLKARADNDIAIAQQALRTKLDDYKEFQKTETELLAESFARKKFNAAHDIELSKSEQKQAVELLEQQYQQELGLVQLAQEQRLFQAKLSLLSETEAMQERYRLEREEILKNTKLSIEERQKLITFSKANQEKEVHDKITGAVQNWGSIQADMNGYGDFYRQDQDRFSRLGAAQDLFDSKSAAVDYSEQSGIEDINSKLQAGLLTQQDFEDQKTAIMQAALEQRNIIYDEYAQNAQEIEDKYQQDRLNAQIALGGQMIGSVTSMFGSMFGEQSKAYKIMFAADKAYAIAAAGIAIQQNIAQAAKIGFPQNLPLIAGAIAQGANIISNIRAIKDQGFAEGGYTGKGGKYEVAGSVHKGEIVWSQDDIKRWGGVNLVESMRKSANPEAFLNNNVSPDNIMRRALMSSNAFIESQKKSNIFNQSGDGQIIYKANQTVDTPKISTGSDLYHDGKVYFSPNGLVQDRSNLEDVHDFTLGRSARPQAETLASVQPSAPTINFKIEVVSLVKGATVEAEQLDENTVRLIVKDELDRTLPRAVPKIVSEQLDDPNLPISRALSKNTTARRNR
ncbi:transglycosylase SLT domain-containing protein [Acinetobacter courvalinii]|uniref:tape measure protein n=1 Tax=Acinetobacter courvalinii TaxID=280147 RepID=UPI0021CF0BD4|nr:tape measure protein [Acinetobacter courvalinii]MCU4576076.1 transglycosylase SLT domain-containing protein [Acinetobacter courvalinii]